jgi:hypothetical protein
VVPGVLALILIPAGFHIGFDVPFLWTVANPVVPIVGFLVLCLSVSSYIMCAFSDPGFLPRATPDEAVHTEKVNNITVDLSGSYYPLPKNKFIDIKSCEYEVKFCTTCKYYRPPRTVHCSTCNMCVERFDHHCPWVSNCVGKRNHKYFYLFLLFTTLLAAYLVAASAIALGLRIKAYQPIGEAFGWSVVSIILGIYAILIMLNVGGMCAGHTYYLVLEYTTNERIKKRYKTKDNKMINPFAQKNKVINCLNMICGAVRPSFFNFTEKVDRNVYEKAEVLQSDLRRQNMAASYSSESLIPVPGAQFLYELMKKRANDNAIFKDELNVINKII